MNLAIDLDLMLPVITIGGSLLIGVVLSFVILLFTNDMIIKPIPTKSVINDSRADRRMFEALTDTGLDQPKPPGASAKNNQERLAKMLKAEKNHESVFTKLLGDVTVNQNVDIRDEIITGMDKNPITLRIHTPKNFVGTMPCVCHFHGGGMCILSINQKEYQYYRSELAALGMVCIGVEFRNAAGELGNYPFPAGLNDCMSALEWINRNKQELGVSGVILLGESGGANLSLALALKAKREHKLQWINGVYAMCPYISSLDVNKRSTLDRLPSLVENNGIFMDIAGFVDAQMLYTPNKKDWKDPLAWPLFATENDVARLPPHVISVNQLDPCRDEGLEYHTKLLNAGVQVRSRMVKGIIHAGDMLFATAMPEVYQSTLTDIAAFAEETCSTQARRKTVVENTLLPKS